MKYSLLMLVISLGLVACSDDNVDKVEGDHVWKQQTDMIDKAKAVENSVLDAANLQRQ